MPVPPMPEAEAVVQKAFARALVAMQEPHGRPVLQLCRQSLHALRRELVKAALEHSRGDATAAAALLGVSKATIKAWRREMP